MEASDWEVVAWGVVEATEEVAEALERGQGGLVWVMVVVALGVAEALEMGQGGLV